MTYLTGQNVKHVRMQASRVANRVRACVVANNSKARRRPRRASGWIWYQASRRVGVTSIEPVVSSASASTDSVYCPPLGHSMLARTHLTLAPNPGYLFSHAGPSRVLYTREVHSNCRLPVEVLQSTTPSGRDLQPRANEMSLPWEIETPRDVSKTLREDTPVYCDSQEKSQKDNTDYCPVFLLRACWACCFVCKCTKSYSFFKNLGNKHICKYRKNWGKIVYQLPPFPNF